MLSTHFLRIILIFIKTRNSRRERGGIPQVFARERGAPRAIRFRVSVFSIRGAKRRSRGNGTTHARDDCAASPALAHVPRPRGGNGTASADDVSAFSIRVPGAGTLRGKRSARGSAHFSFLRILMKASCGMETFPISFIRFLPSFCLSSSLRLRVMSPP